MNEQIKPEIRQNKITKRWVIYAPDRVIRPAEKTKGGTKKPLAEYDKNCPFCPGNELMLPPIIMELPGKNGWQTRAVSNKYPALNRDGKSELINRGIYQLMDAYGVHEVIIENPVHNKNIALMSYIEIKTVVEMYYERYQNLMKETNDMQIVIFRNQGKNAGASLSHPHSQLIASKIRSHNIQWREQNARQYYDRSNHCIWCDIVEFELKDRTRIVYENNSFVGFVPFSAEVPYEIWIVPKKHLSDFSFISETERTDLTLALKDILGKLYKKLNDPDYNYVINSASLYKSIERHLHWYIRIMPRIQVIGGFEIGTGTMINPSLPEEDAALLNKNTP